MRPAVDSRFMIDRWLLIARFFAGPRWRVSRGSRPCSLTLALLIGAAAGGCATTDPDLSVRLTNLRFEDATLWETTAVMAVRIENERPEPIAVKGAVHKLYVNGDYLGKGMTGDATEVPAFGTAVQTVRIHLRNLNMAGRFRAIYESQRVDYLLSSRLHAESGGGGRVARRRVEDAGSLDLGPAFKSASGRDWVAPAPADP